MSGGSYDYRFEHIERLAYEIRKQTSDPKRRAFADLLDLCAKAAHDIEWVDSGDYGRGDEIPAIEAALNFNGADAVTNTLIRDLEDAMRRAAEHLNALRDEPTVEVAA